MPSLSSAPLFWLELNWGPAYLAVISILPGILHSSLLFKSLRALADGRPWKFTVLSGLSWFCFAPTSSSLAFNAASTLHARSTMSFASVRAPPLT
eukprot:8722055-Pyramimonas_sp.AAC.1